MSLFSVTVKKARFVGPQASQLNTYVTLKLQNVKSTTVTVKGASPCWEQDFLFETNDVNAGLLIEVWNKGLLWDKAMGFHYVPLTTVQYSNEEGQGQWLPLEAELVMTDGEVIGTKLPTGHSLLVDCRFELPFDPENIESADLQRKLEMLNNIMDQEAKAEQARRQMQYFGQSGHSEDSDYTSDLNYPVGGQHANSSASQFLATAHGLATPQRSLEASRENSYERDDVNGRLAPGNPQENYRRLSPGTRRRQKSYSPGYAEEEGCGVVDSEPFELYYNSRPRKTRNNVLGGDSTDYYYDGVDSSGYYGDATNAAMRRNKAMRRPSLERQSTLYDDNSYYPDYYSEYQQYTTVQGTCVPPTGSFDQYQSCEEYYDTVQYPVQEERYGQDERNRQWDSGGVKNNFYPPVRTGKKLPQIPLEGTRRRTPAIVEEPEYTRPTPTPLGRRRMPQIPTKRSASRQSSINDDTYSVGTTRGASLPPTPTKNTSRILARIQNQNKTPNSLPTTPGRQLPKPNVAKARRMMPRTGSEEYSTNQEGYENYYLRSGAVSARDDISSYNEDYNYAYESLDNLEENQQTQITAVTTASSDITTKYNVNVNNYYSSLQNDDGYYNDNYYVEPVENKILSNRGNILQDKTDSIESRDEELKDSSFDTVVSSVPSSFAQQFKNTTENTNSNNTNTNTTTTFVSGLAKSLFGEGMKYFQGEQQQQKQQPEQPKAIIIEENSTHNNTSSIFNRSSNGRGVLKQQESIEEHESLNNQRGYLSQQDTIESTYYPAQDDRISNHFDDVYNEYHEVDDERYLDTKESLESFVEEDENAITNGYAHTDTSTLNAINLRESPPISLDDTTSLRRGSSQVTVVDPYHPSLQKRPSIIGQNNRKSSIPEANRRPSNESYGYDINGVTNRKSSLAATPPPEVEETAAVPQIVEEEVLEPEKKSVSFEEEEEKQQRPQITAKQRWLWAYNKIIMQLNVSEQTPIR